MSQVRIKLVAGNWKMNGSLAANAALLGSLLPMLGGRGGEVAVCVPSPYLGQVADLLRGSRIALGAQNASEHASGAYTGEVSLGMLADFGCRYVIVGHSERRALYGETNGQVGAKAKAVVTAGLVPIACVGETWPEREANTTESVIAAQLDAILGALDDVQLSSLVVAYEPVWAIGTGKTATPEQAQAVHAFIRARVARRSPAIAAGMRILYGGSVSATNAATLFACADVDGGLVGGASLKAADFAAICGAAGA
jgi:triosephosphate isomerase